MASPAAHRLLLPLGLLLCAGLSLGDLRWGGLAAPAYEELLNARAAVLAACGHWSELSLLQYRFFCGGCTVDAAVGAGPIALLGPTELAWKLVPLLWQLLALAAVCALARAVSGARGVLVVLALWLGAPTAWRELLLTGWGNHAESAAFTFGAAALLLQGRRSSFAALAAGGLAAFGLYYAWISAHALPALLLGALLVAGLRGLLAFLLGAPLGLLPWYLVERGEHGILGSVGRPEVPEAAREMATSLSPTEPAVLWEWWAIALRPGRLWQVQDGPWATAGAAVAAVVLLLGLTGALLGLVSLRRRHPASVALVLPALGLCGLVGATALRQDLWAEVPELLGYSPFLLRYRTPAFPLVVLGCGVLAGLPRLGRPAAALAVLLGTGGLAARLASWELDSPRDLGAELEVTELTADPTVPGGAPEQRDPRLRTRDADVAAAEAFLARHADPLAVCETIHEVELDRRRRGCRRPGCRE